MFLDANGRKLSLRQTALTNWVHSEDPRPKGSSRVTSSTPLCSPPITGNTPPPEAADPLSESPGYGNVLSPMPRAGGPVSVNWFLPSGLLETLWPCPFPSLVLQLRPTFDEIPYPSRFLPFCLNWPKTAPSVYNHGT